MLVLPATQRRDSLLVDAPRSEVETVPGRRTRLSCLGQAASLLVGLRPRAGHLRAERKDRRPQAAHDSQGLRRRGGLFARRSVDCLHFDARRLQPHAQSHREGGVRARPEPLRRHLHHEGRRHGTEASEHRVGLRRRSVLHARRHANRVAALRRIGSPGGHLDHEAGWQGPETNHDVRLHELVAVRVPVR